MRTCCVCCRLHLERRPRRSAARRAVDDIRMKRFLDLADSAASRSWICSRWRNRCRTSRSRRRSRQDSRVGVFNPSLRTLASFQAVWRGSGGLLRHHTGAGHVAAGDPVERHHERRRGRAHSRGNPGSRVVLRCARSAGLCRGQEPRERHRRDAVPDDRRPVRQADDQHGIGDESSVPALADWRTLDELGVPRRAKFVLSWVYHPKALPLAVPSATLHMAAMRAWTSWWRDPRGLPCRPRSWTRRAPRLPRRRQRAETADRRRRSRVRTCSTPRSGNTRTMGTSPRTRACVPACRSGASERWFAGAGPTPS